MLWQVNWALTFQDPLLVFMHLQDATILRLLRTKERLVHLLCLKRMLLGRHVFQALESLKLLTTQHLTSWNPSRV